MSAAAVAACGWACALAASAVAALAVTRLRDGSVRVARAAHELRGGLCAARLGLHAAGRHVEPESLSAVDLQLQRATRALAELDGTPVVFASSGDSRNPFSSRNTDGEPLFGPHDHEAPELIDVDALLADVADAWSPLGTVEIDWTDAPVFVRGDRVALLQACGNLVGNALEHGTLPIVLRARRAGERVRIEVLDAGPGLPAPVAVLVAAARRRRGPRGHGLAIAADIVERHGGRIGAAPVAEGARVVIELDALESPTQASS